MEIYWVVQKIELKMCSDEIFLKHALGVPSKRMRKRIFSGI